MQRIIIRSSVTATITTAIAFTSNENHFNYKSYSDRKGQPSFNATINLTREPRKTDEELNITLDSISLISGSAHRSLTQDIASIMNVSIAEAEVSRFSDGEVNIAIEKDLSGKDIYNITLYLSNYLYHYFLTGKDVYIIQTCAAPVNDNIMELLLTVSCARRAGASRIVAVIPYFAYKHHRRGAALSTKHQSRFLTSNAKDFAKMLKEMGVDSVIAVDLQRPGQGHEACFFDSSVYYYI
jgi:ribose-phosphate pyrophosphokinase